MILLGIFLTVLFLFSLISKRARATVITAPIVFTIAGMLGFFVLPEASQSPVNNKTVLVIGEITLALVLFSDASRINLRKVMREYQLPSRLLGIGMPLTIMLGGIVALLLFSDFSIWEAAILATILAPTDASLGAAILHSKRVPAIIRRALNLESGLNDGLSIPLLMLFIALASANTPLQDGTWLVFTVQQIGFGLLVGLLIGWLGSFLAANAEKKGWMTNSAHQLVLIAIAILSWWLAEKVVGGNGFIAAFVAGVLVREGYHEAHERMAEFSEAWGDLLIYLIFFFFGLMAMPQIEHLIGPYWIYALLSLTLVRMLPVGLAMLGTRLHISSVLFLGWFGPRGLASIILGLIFLEQKTHLSVEPTIILAIIATVLLSVFAHGISAAPAINLYSRHLASLGPDAPERKEVGAIRPTNQDSKTL
ncbi:MAG: cation:proton antiporter [Anaerolineales bacterium]|nr:cation:proton antiporter [Anaerolineales bacterium]